LGKLTEEERIANGKRNVELHGSYLAKLTPEQRIANGRKSLETNRKKYHVEGRFYTQSKQEGAVALLLEEFVYGTRATEDGVNFQVKDRRINNGGIDFLVGGEFLEWHPIILHMGRRGDVESKEELDSYRKLTSVMTPEQKKEFDKKYKQVLAVNYRNTRQESVNNSGYAGAQVTLAKDPQELYGFISARATKPVPSFDEFRREFKKLQKYVGSFEVKKGIQEERQKEVA
jgi:hypothetical protein